MSARRPPVMGVALVVATAAWVSIVAVGLAAVGRSGFAVVLAAFAFTLLLSAGITMTRRTR